MEDFQKLREVNMSIKAIIHNTDINKQITSTSSVCDITNHNTTLSFSQPKNLETHLPLLYI